MAKRALCIGINNYPGTQNDLAGCVNDAEDWAVTLQARGFAVTKMLDSQATKTNRVQAIEDLIGAAVASHSLIITYSGHGTFVPDTQGDEPNARDEALCPYDIDRGNVLLDGEIHALFQRRPARVKLVLISDSCHSGSVIQWAPPDRDSDAPLPRFLPPAAWMPVDALPKRAHGEVLTRVGTGTRPMVLSAGSDLPMAGCQDQEFSCRLHSAPLGRRYSQGRWSRTTFSPWRWRTASCSTPLPGGSRTTCGALTRTPSAMV